MNEEHDVIYITTNQRDCVESIEVQVEDVDVRDINNYATNWLNEQNSAIDSKWTITTDSLEGS
ncbi:hypothetical protein [Guptibacillus sedimenti]|uniref:hypothetical protein n=1 Tax=Guptibacillus sedimenti TaxID=3025680 RepID=UPI002360C787|nr:hypothetical protein [Pseudalkalibacillus sedimenti]